MSHSFVVSIIGDQLQVASQQGWHINESINRNWCNWIITYEQTIMIVFKLAELN